jgi:UDP-N-acetylmuramyl pentapeptide phosphotransferase/UDP-N-acetylglucosamine-1-phosphate transferase
MNSMIVVYFFFSFLLLFVTAKISYKLNLTDIPNTRKIHTKPTAYTGGLTISISILLMSLFLDIQNGNLNLILYFVFFISLIGLTDDIFELNVVSKLIFQIIPIFYLITFENLTLFHLGDYNYFKLVLGTFSMPVTLISILILINSFNYFDGIDGTLGFSLISVLGILYFLTPDENLRLFLIIIFIPMLIFLFFNFSLFTLPKMFLGNGGSLMLGFLTSFYLIYLANKNFVHPILLAWTIVIFVYEFLSINFVRLKNKKKLFKAGQDHLHHILFNNTKSIFLTNFFISTANIILFIIGYFSFVLINPLASLILFIFFFITYLIGRINILKKN